MKAAEIERYLMDYSRISSWNRLKFEKLRVVLTRMQKAEIDCILLKGADIVPRLYGVLGLRALFDVDMLVHESDLAALDSLLTQLGYRSQIDGNPAYVDPDGVLFLDIVTKIWYVRDQALVWQRASPRDFAGISIKGLGASDLLVYLTAYNVVHRGYLSASFARDIAVLVDKEDVDWDFVVDEASRSHLKVPLHHGLSFVSARSAGVRIPHHVLRNLAPSTVLEKIWSLVFGTLVTDEPIAGLGHLLLFLTQPRSKKWHWLNEALFPSAAFLKYRYGDRWEAHSFSTRLSRPFHLLSEASRLFIRVMRRLITARA